jgi:hypothetical protein
VVGEKENKPVGVFPVERVEREGLTDQGGDYGYARESMRRARDAIFVEDQWWKEQ